MNLSRRAFTTGSLGLAVAAAALGNAAQAQTLSSEDQAAVDRAVAYLQGLNSARGTFSETGPGGQTSRGSFYLQRPGKMRFEYSTPAGLVVVSDGQNVMRYDPRLETFRQVPLSQTPLSAFLARNITLANRVRIDRVSRGNNGSFAIVARSTSRPNDGTITLAFAGNPMRLHQWIITDAQGQQTRTVLDTLQPASGLAASLFQLRDPTRRPGRN